MDATNQQKLLNAGFTIIRKEDHIPGKIRIKFKDATNREWKTLQDGFASKAELERRMKFLLSDSKTLED